MLHFPSNTSSTSLGSTQPRCKYYLMTIRVQISTIRYSQNLTHPSEWTGAT